VAASCGIQKSAKPFYKLPLSPNAFASFFTPFNFYFLGRN